LAVAALTADILPTDRERCMDAGMDDYLNKPIKLARVAAWFKNASEKITTSHPVAGVRSCVAVFLAHFVRTLQISASAAFNNQRMKWHAGFDRQGIRS
jgi:CheY-like chemotaxis protein